MSRFVCSTVALVALLVLAMSPVFAADAETPDTAPAALEAPTLEELPAEPPNVTPAPQEDLEIGTGQDLLFHAIRICEDDEELQCPPGCACVVIREVVNCFC